jgi:hypothetical protein
LVTRGLDAAQGAAEFINLAFVSQFLALGELDEFEDFIQLVNGVLERFGDLGGVQDGLMDGGNIGGTKISGFDPGFGTGGFRAAVIGAILTFLTFRPVRSLLPFGSLGAFWSLLWTQGRGALGAFRSFRVFRRVLRLGVAFRFGCAGFFGVRLAKTAGGIDLGFSFCGFGMVSGSF